MPDRAGPRPTRGFASASAVAAARASSTSSPSTSSATATSSSRATASSSSSTGRSLPYVDGSTIDYVDSLQGAGFQVNNPNVVAACGCGSSFRVADEEQVSAV